MASRRDLLRSVLAGAAAMSAARLGALPAPTPKTLVGGELTDREKVIHMFNRLSFGPRPGEVDHVLQEEGVAGWIKTQLVFLTTMRLLSMAGFTNTTFR